MLEVDIAGHRGDFNFAANFKNDGMVTAIFGPSGAGKTTIINALSGLVTPTNGIIKINGNTLFDSVSNQNMKIRKRKVAQIFQDARLFPHMNVKSNLTYARWAGRRKRTVDFDHVVSLLGIEDLLKRMPDTLSGGEKQRVAIGRALLSDPSLLLLDEPLSGLDYTRRLEIMPYFQKLAREFGIPLVYVSHYLNEIIRIADYLVVMEKGRVVQNGAMDQTLPQIRGKYDGVNLAPISLVRAEFDAVYGEDGLTRLKLGIQTLTVPQILEPRSRPYRIRLDARDVSLALEEPLKISVQNILRGRIFEIQEAGEALRDISLNVDGQIIVSRITARALRALDLKVDQAVYLMIKSAAVEGL